MSGGFRASVDWFYRWLWYHTEFWLPPEKRKSYSRLVVEFEHDQPLIWTVLCLWVGYWFNRFFMTELRDWVLLSIGILMGHFWWNLKER